MGRARIEGGGVEGRLVDVRGKRGNGKERYNNLRRVRREKRREEKRGGNRLGYSRRGEGIEWVLGEGS